MPRGPPECNFLKQTGVAGINISRYDCIMLTNNAPPTTALRILETTDLHMHVLAYDYFADRADPQLGLISLAGLIAQMRQDDPAGTLLFDNGDFLQGNPLGDLIAATPKQDEIHPMISAMNTLGYDAVTLGNHDFDYGLPFLRRSLLDAKASTVSANVSVGDGPALAQPFIIMVRELRCSDGIQRTVKIGVTGFAPQQPGCFGKTDALQVHDIIVTAHYVSHEMKTAGADITVALCHAGIGPSNAGPDMENAAVPLAAIAGIDVVLLGHTHGSFPDPAGQNTADIDYNAGTLHGKPAVMAGYYGTSLGVIDLQLEWRDAGWHIIDRNVACHRPTSATQQDTTVTNAIAEATEHSHQATLRAMRRPVTRTRVPIHSYFATIQPDLSLQLVAQAMQNATVHALSQTTFADLPVLAAASPFRGGGHHGRGHFIDIPPGDVTRRDVAAMFPFADLLCGVIRTGAQIRHWLERSAAHYSTIVPNCIHQPLLNPQSPIYHCDSIYGLSYSLDLTQPPRFDAFGRVSNPTASRLCDVRFQDQHIRDGDHFVVATNSFRASGGGGFAQTYPQDILWQSETKLADILHDSLRDGGIINSGVDPIWSFRPIPNAKAQFTSAKAAIHHMPSSISQDCPQTATYSLRF
jgi:2',3'-cyclic-nucleotide 2'-phosphodiesterase/3'-nucleotidase